MCVCTVVWRHVFGVFWELHQLEFKEIRGGIRCSVNWKLVTWQFNLIKIFKLKKYAILFMNKNKTRSGNFYLITINTCFLLFLLFICPQIPTWKIRDWPIHPINFIPYFKTFGFIFTTISNLFYQNWLYDLGVKT